MLPLVACGALHPVGRLLPHGGDPGARLAAAEQRSGVDPHGEPLAVVLAEGGRRGVGPLRRRIVGQVVERAAERLDRPRADVGGPLRDLDAAEVHRVDEPVRLRSAPVVGRAVRESVDGGADLRLVDGDLKAAHGDVARPVVEAVGVPLLDRHTGKVVHHRRHGGDVRLLHHHRLGDHAAGEDARLLGDDADGLQEPLDLQHQLNRRRGVGLHGDRGLGRREAGQRGRDDVVAARQRVEDERPGRVRDALARPFRTRCRHHDAGQRSARRVGHRALDRTVGLAGDRGRGNQRGENHSAQEWQNRVLGHGGSVLIAGWWCVGRQRCLLGWMAYTRTRTALLLLAAED